MLPVTAGRHLSFETGPALGRIDSWALGGILIGEERQDVKKGKKTSKSVEDTRWKTAFDKKAICGSRRTRTTLL